MVQMVDDADAADATVLRGGAPQVMSFTGR
jgi:hypothetical protein